MSIPDNTDTSATDAVKTVILAAAPERKEELAVIWADYSPSFSLMNDKPGFNFQGGPFGLILFTSRSMSYLWLLGFAAQTALLHYCPVPIYSTWVHQFDPLYFQSIRETSYSQRIRAIEALSAVENEKDFTWPSGIPHPRHGKPTDASGAVVFDLLCMAAAYVFLHEVEHVKIGSREIKMKAIDEEMQCDNFARELLLGKIEEYSESSGFPQSLVSSKRAMSIALASFFLLVITPRQSWGGSRSHPSITERITALTDSLALPLDDHFWIYFSSIILAQLRYKGIELAKTAVLSPRDFCLHLMQYIV